MYRTRLTGQVRGIREIRGKNINMYRTRLTGQVRGIREIRGK